jgi:putative transposase
VEDLNVKGMQANHKLARSLSDVSLGKFYEILSYKCDWYGINYIEIGRFEPSSKMCPCGKINKKLTLSQREWTCECGKVLDRDKNAADNIRKFGLSKVGIEDKIGQELPEYTSVEMVLVDDRAAMYLKSTPSLKQEIHDKEGLGGLEAPTSLA